MDFKGTGWVAVQDIGGFTPLSENLARKGKSGTETLTKMLNGFFQKADDEITSYDGRIFKLAGDAFYALFPGQVSKSAMTKLGEKLLNIPVLREARLRSRFIAVKGLIEARWIDLNHQYHDLAIKGSAIYDLSLLEDQTPAGAQRIIESSQENILTRLPAIPGSSRTRRWLPAHRPMYIIFIQIPPDFKILSETTDYLRQHWPTLKLLKWLPGAHYIHGLLISGFPESTGKDAETTVHFYYALRKHFPNLTFKLGMSSGMVYAGDLGGRHYREFTVIGDRVNVAARLMQIAPAMTLYFSSEIYQAIRGKFKIKLLGAIPLKGKTEKIEVCQPVRQIINIFEPSLFSHQLVGRKYEIHHIRNLVRRGQSTCIIAEAGMGKSRILYEIRRALKHPYIIEIGLPPISPPLFFFKELSQHFPIGDFSELPDYLTGKIKLPLMRVVELLRQMFNSKPGLILLVEDFHWIDEISLTLLKGLKKLPFLMIASSRPGMETAIKELNIKPIPLRPLGKQEILTLAASILQMSLTTSLARLLLDKSQGNPFYLEQIIYHLREHNAIEIINGRASLIIGIESLPFGIHAILLSRLSRQPLASQKILEIAACIGREFELRTISKIIPQAVTLLNRSIQDGILTISGGIYLFKHALFQEAILSSMLEANRTRYETAISRIFIDEKKPIYEIAYHLTRAGLIQEASLYWNQVYDNLYDQGLETEINNLIDKLNHDPNPRVRPLALFLNICHLISSSDYFDAETMLRQMRRNPDLRKRALFRLCNIYDFSGRYSRLAATLKQLRYCSLSPSEKIEYLELKGIYHDMSGDNHRGLICYHRALTLARQQGINKAIIANLHNIGWINQKEKHYQTARRCYLKARSYIEEGDRTNEGIIHLRLGQIELHRLNLDLSRQYLRQSEKIFQKLSYQFWLWLTYDGLFFNALLAGNKKESRRYARLTDISMIEQKRTPYCELIYLLYWQEYDKFLAMNKGQEQNYDLLYYVYLYAVGQVDAAEKFLQKNRDRIILPDSNKKTEKNIPSIFVLLYNKYVKPKHRAQAIMVERPKKHRGRT